MNEGPWGTLPSPAPLDEDIEVDIAILGSGMTGSLAAYLLAQEGCSVAVFDNHWGGIATMRTTAFLVETIDTSASELIELYGTEKAARILRSHREAIAFYEKLSRDEGIECDFMRCPLYLYACDTKESEELESERKALIELGVEITDGDIRIQNEGCIAIEGQAKMNPLRLMEEIQARAVAAGARLYGSEVKVEDAQTLHAGSHRIHARHVLLATHYPYPQPAWLFFKKARYVSFVMECFIPAGALVEGLYEDLDTPYHYLRVDAQGEEMRVLIGGEDRRADIKTPEEKHYEALRTYAHQVLPSIIREGMRWKGPIIESGDGLAFIGPHEDLFYATGHSGNGMTYAVIAAQAFRDYVLERENSYQDLYAADRPVHLRPHMKKAVEYIEEFAGGAVEDVLE
jgi:glycine/D-amino acid oxidase-like deaminating enzyme